MLHIALYSIWFTHRQQVDLHRMEKIVHYNRVDLVSETMTYWLQMEVKILILKIDFSFFFLSPKAKRIQKCFFFCFLEEQIF